MFDLQRFAVSKEELLSVLTRYNKTEVANNEAKFVKQVTGKDLSSNDYTDAEKSKLAGIAAGAQVNTIETISLNGVTQTNTNKNVALSLTAYALKTDLEIYAKSADLTSALKYQGTKASFSALPSTAAKGDVWNITNAGGTDANGTPVKAGDNVAYNGSGWDVLGGTTDLSAYLTSANAAATYLTQTDANNTYLSKTTASGDYLTKTDAASTYVAQVSGKGLSTNDFTNDYKNKVDDLYANANEKILDSEIAAIFATA